MYSYTTVYEPPAGYEDLAPYTVALVKLGVSLGQVEPTFEDIFEAVFLGIAGFISSAFTALGAILVLFMTAPGLTMFYSGLVRKKNVLGVMMQCLFLMGLSSMRTG